ncbi:HNH endonuclease signature motif containing protein [Pseudonocardia sp.]|uniref:HNH endonuclease signature motif containing protein n=1 Tax=Pseudonocardia sp. TaxID=60912 RepID=UPI002606E037|nr:HNH endonuclease signature motif containing protein [Pseudonocardia sp.]
MSTSRVESELVEMAGHLAAGTCRFLQLLAEFDERAGWAGPGLRTCAQWLNWRVGLSLRTARDHLRVAHALRRLPLITAAFAAGRVSYSKVRAMTRIATPATEEGLLSVALHGTTSQLEGLVQAARAATDPRPARARRGLWTSRAADGSLLVRLRVPAEQGEELMSAIEALVAQEAGRDGSAEPSGPEQAPGDVADPRAARRLDALLDLAAGATLENPATVVVHLRADGPEAVADRPAAWIDGGPPIPVPVAERLGCAASVQALLVDRRGNPLFLGRERRLVTRRQLRALRVRDRGRCVYPGCTSTRRLQAHHVRWWRHGGATDLDNLALVCGFHHALVHDHGYRMETVEGGGFAFARPDGAPVPVAGAPTCGDVESLVSPGVDDRTITPRWGGERLDRDHFLTWLLPARRREEDRAAA